MLWFSLLFMLLQLLLIYSWQAHSTKIDNNRSNNNNQLSIVRESLFKALRQFGHCQHLYLDMGTNVGVQLRKLYEPEYYPKAPVLPIFQGYFGNTNRKHICAIGFEPNVAHTQHLQQMQMTYQAAGYPLFILTETALYSNDESLTIYEDKSQSGSEHHEWGTSITDWQHNHSNALIVNGLDTGKFLKHILAVWVRTLASRIIVKLDIEGAEYAVLSSIIGHGVLCQLDLILAEWHQGTATEMMPFASASDMSKMLQMIVSHTSNCKLHYYELDDESYADEPLDKHPYPPPIH